MAGKDSDDGGAGWSREDIDAYFAPLTEADEHLDAAVALALGHFRGSLDAFDHLEGRLWSMRDDFLAAMPEAGSPRRASAKEPIPSWLRRDVFERDAYRCQHCGDWHNLSVDHIHPESKGGTLDLSNLQTLCVSCNSKKGSRS